MTIVGYYDKIISLKILKGETNMKTEIQPNYHEVTVVCACGNTFKTGSCVNGDTIKVDICNKCHPFFTGKQKVVDASGRLEKFKAKHNM